MTDKSQTTGSTGANDPVRCGYCGQFHQTKCHLVKAFEYHSDGTVKRVEFYAPNEYGPILGISQHAVPASPNWVTPSFRPATTCGVQE